MVLPTFTQQTAIDTLGVGWPHVYALERSRVLRDEDYISPIIAPEGSLSRYAVMYTRIRAQNPLSACR